MARKKKEAAPIAEPEEVLDETKSSGQFEEDGGLQAIEDQEADAQERTDSRDDDDRLEEEEYPDDIAATEVAAKTLTGDLRRFILDTLRHEQDKRPWDQRSEFEQRATVSRVENAVRDMVQKSVEIIAADGKRTIKAVLEQITVKDAIVGKIIVSRHDEQRYAIMDASGSKILIVVADLDEFDGEREPAAIKPDQPDMIKAVTVVHSKPDGVAETPFH